MKTLTAVLFAGGLSTRMGRDKATLVTNGGPLWRRQWELLRAAQPEQLAVSARIAPEWLPQDARLFLDAPPSRGPLSGLAAVLASMTSTHALVLAVDLIDMRADYLRELWSACAPGRGVVPMRKDLFEPLCAIYPRESWTAARDALEGDRLSLQRLVKTLCDARLLIPMEVTPAGEPFFRNVNAPQDLSDQ